MIRTIHGRLTALMLGLFYLAGFFFILLVLFSNRMYFREASQKLNRNIAKQIVSKQDLLRDGQVNHESLSLIYRDLLAVNPTITVYILDLYGHILSSSVELSSLQQDHVSMEPLIRFAGGEEAFPILGDDPADPDRRKVFSACAIPIEGPPEGYLYITLGEGEHESISRMLTGSHIARLSIFAVLSGIVLVSLVGLLLFRHLTRRLRLLTREVEAFKEGDFSEPETIVDDSTEGSGDEIDQLHRMFHEMALRIGAQVRELKDSDTLRRELITNISHDLRTPLTSLQGYLETLAMKADLADEERHRYMDTAIRHSNRLRQLVADLFELAKLDAGEVRYHPEPFSLSELILDILQKYELRAEEKGVRLNSDFSAHLPFVKADIGLVERALENLLRNALQYTSAGGSVTVSIGQQEETLVVRVKDTGVGISEQDIPYIFDRYYRSKETEDHHAEGTGLGLAITKRIIELHGRSIEVRSTAGEGSVFSFSLPVSTA
ncbi:MAG: HAMP domain-containing histidine kinase [bacterium]|nr:MAG: HAMP domain-containing histidine kinase [bacterium]